MKLVFEVLVVSLMSALRFASAAKCINGVDPATSRHLDDSFDPTNWPEMWRMMTDDIIEEGDSRQEPNRLGEDDVDATVLASAGVQYMHLDPTGFDYPEKAIPWEPNATTSSLDPVLAALRDERDFSYADIITVTGRVDSFWTEHFHEFDTIRYIINGTGYFDLRDANNEWVRFSVKAGDFFLWPGGIYHRFTVDDNNFVTAMRLFQGAPVWNSFVREEVKGNHSARMNYVDTYLCGQDPDAEVPATEAPTLGSGGTNAEKSSPDSSSTASAQTRQLLTLSVLLASSLIAMIMSI